MNQEQRDRLAAIAGKSATFYLFSIAEQVKFHEMYCLRIGFDEEFVAELEARLCR